MSDSRDGVLYNLHLLRLIAALGVVYFHITSEAGLNLEWNVGSRGVDLFFVISGFIIAYVGTANPDQFLLRRLIRVAPLYWAATLFVFAIAAAAPQLLRSTTANLTHLVMSLLFIPHEFRGEMQPTLLLGWTLNFEMFFYVLFALALLVSQRWSPAITVGWIVAYVLAIHALDWRHPVTDFYARPIVVEFCFGIATFYVFKWCVGRRDELAGRRAVAWALPVVIVISLIVLVVGEMYKSLQPPRLVVAGIPSFFIVTSAVLLERVYRVATNNRLIYLLGDSSYIIYLVHPYIVFAVLRVVVKGANVWPLPMVVLLIVALLALTSAIAAAIHVAFEKPVMAYLHARFIRRRQRPQAGGVRELVGR